MLEVIWLDLVGLASAISLQGKRRSGGPARNAGPAWFWPGLSIFRAVLGFLVMPSSLSEEEEGGVTPPRTHPPTTATAVSGSSSSLPCPAASSRSLLAAFPAPGVVGKHSLAASSRVGNYSSYICVLLKFERFSIYQIYFFSVDASSRAN